MTITVVESKAEWEHDIHNHPSVVIDCFATWCGPYKQIAPKVVNLSEEYKNVVFCEVDVDVVPSVASDLDVGAMPTFVFFKNGRRIHEVVGANAAALETALKSRF